MIMRRDTHPEAERVLISVLRSQTAVVKLRTLDEEFELARSLMRAGIRLRKADASSEEIEAEYLELLLGRQLADRVLAFRRLRQAGSTPSLRENGSATR
jgi:hypothetical protein